MPAPQGSSLLQAPISGLIDTACTFRLPESSAMMQASGRPFVFFGATSASD